MANTNLIYTYIQDSGYKLQYVASVLHISSNTLRHKLLGETQVKLDEAERRSTMLGLTMAERAACLSLAAAAGRDGGRLLVVDRATGALEARIFRDIADYLRPNDLLIANETRVMPARLLGAQRGPGGSGQGAGKPRQGNLVGLRAASISQHVAYDIEGVVVRSICVPLRLQDLAF